MPRNIREYWKGKDLPERPFMVADHHWEAFVRYVHGDETLQAIGEAVNLSATSVSWAIRRVNSQIIRFSKMSPEEIQDWRDQVNRTGEYAPWVNGHPPEGTKQYQKWLEADETTRDIWRLLVEEFDF